MQKNWHFWIGMNKKSVTVPGLLQMKMKVNWIGMARVRRVIAVFG